MITSEKTDKILSALFEVKKKIKPMTRDAKNPFYKSNYLDLPNLLENLEPILLDNDLVLTQSNAHRHGSEYIISRITHVGSQQFVESEYRIGEDSDPQKFGAKSTYGRRYSLKGLLAISEVDDDGNTASGKTVKSKTSSTKTTASKPANKPTGSSSGFGGNKPAETTKTTPARAGSFGG